MNDTLGIIMTGFGDSVLGELTQVRARAALPICGRYRLIDFTLSNMVNSGITNVGVPTTTHYRSLMDHLGSGKEWDLNRKLYGLFILPPYLNRETADTCGDIDILNGVMDYLVRSKQKYVLLTGSNSIYNTDYSFLKDFHIAHGADITVLTTKNPNYLSAPTGVQLNCGTDCKVKEIELGAASFRDPQSSMGVYFLEKELLCRAISRCVSRGHHDFIRDILLHGTDELNVYACPFNGHVGLIDSVSSYMRESKALLEPAVYAEIFNPRNPIYTKVKDQIPTIYGPNAVVRNSIIADGCTINGTVENSIIFRGVEVSEGSIVSNSIVMQQSQIQKGVLLDCAILDKSVVVRHNKRLIGQESYPIVIGKNAMV
ncbi:MAG: glucose-1-phosphate adenylyltransferase subunit GlgD [Ruminococcaceae bacterium]|nr:glucose-1-phosphate adenylyltransferase subunit GlgD [Oscillospiraceae bacterium]